MSTGTPITPDEAQQYRELIENAEHGTREAVIYEVINTIVDRNGINVAQAFDALAEVTGRKAAALSSAYYRFRRGLLPSAGGRAVDIGNNEIVAEIDTINAAIGRLVKLTEAVVKENQRLRETQEQYETIRRLVTLPK